MKKVYFVCFTVYHLFVSLYYAHKLDHENTKHYLIWYNWFKNVKIDPFMFSSQFDGVYVIQGEEGKYKKYLNRLKISGYFAPQYYKKTILNNSPQNSILIIFSDEHQPTWRLMQLFSRDKSNKIVLVEEGTTTYEINKVYYSTKEKINRFLFGCVGESNIGVSPHINSYIVKKPSLMPLQKTNQKPVLKQNSMFDDIEWLQKLNVLSSEAINELNQFQGIRVLWLGQPLNVVGVNLEDEARIMNEIISSFDSQYSVFIKKHPTDQIEKYDLISKKSTCKYFVTHDTWIPVEVLVGQIEPDIIITPFSSAALNLYELGYGKRVIFCYKLFGLSIDDSWLTPHLENPDIRNASTLEKLRQIIDEYEKNPIRNNTEDLTVNDNADIDYLNSLLKDD